MRDWPIPMFAWPLLGVAVVVVLALILPEDETLPVLTRDLPSLHQIEEGDVVMKPVSDRGLDESVVTDRDALVGRVTRTAVSMDEPVATTAITETEPPDYSNLVPAAFNAVSNTAGDIASGQEIELLFAPTPDATEGVPLEVDAVLIDSREAESGGTDYVVALSAADRTEMLAIVGRSRLLVVPAR